MEYYNNNFPQFPVIHTSARAEYRPEITRVTRLFLEALEIAFFLCNCSFERYGLSKLFDVVNQILPTAYILNTAYWVFYSTQLGNSICICVRFGIRCPHRRNDLHWINLASGPFPEAEECFHFSVNTGEVPHPTDINVFIEPFLVDDLLRGYHVNTRLSIQTMFRNRNTFAPSSDSQTTLLIESRYLLTSEYNPFYTTIVQFMPHPTTHPNYAKYFKDLIKLSEGDNILWEQVITPRTTTIVPTNPSFRLLPNLEGHSIFYRTATPSLTNSSHPLSTIYGNFKPSPMILEQIMIDSELPTNGRHPSPHANKYNNNHKTPKRQQNMQSHASTSQPPRRPNHQKLKKSTGPNFGDSSTHDFPSTSFSVQSEHSYTTPTASDKKSKRSLHYSKNAQVVATSSSKAIASKPPSPHFSGSDYERIFPSLPAAPHVAQNLNLKFPDVMDNEVSFPDNNYENGKRNISYANANRDFGKSQCDTPYRAPLANCAMALPGTSASNSGTAQPNPLVPTTNGHFEEARNERITLTENLRKLDLNASTSPSRENLEENRSVTNSFGNYVDHFLPVVNNNGEDTSEMENAGNRFQAFYGV